jgi:hypothetical protein
MVTPLFQSVHISSTGLRPRISPVKNVPPPRLPQAMRDQHGSKDISTPAEMAATADRIAVLAGSIAADIVTKA